MTARKHMRWASWIGIVAILISSFAPLVSHAFANTSSQDFVQQICTAEGTKTLSVDGSAPQPIKVDHQQHCPYCALHSTAVLDSNVAHFVPAQEESAFAVVSYIAPSINLFFLHNHPSHAPPQFA